MPDPWSILGLRRFTNGATVWQGYADALRRAATEPQRRRARDAFEAIELGLLGRFNDSIDPDWPDPPRDDLPLYDGPLAGQLDEIDRLLAYRPIDEPAVRDRLSRLFDDPAMQLADNYLRVEPRLADLLERQLPHSEPFVLFALDRFRHVTEQATGHPAIARLLDRADELSMVARFEDGKAHLTDGWRPLEKPARPLQRWFWARDDRRGQMATLYAYAGWRNPRFRRRLNVGEWAWWSRELSRERTSTASMLAALTAAIIVGVAMYQRAVPVALLIGTSVAIFAFLLLDEHAARAVIARSAPRPFDRRRTIAIACAAFLLPGFTRFLPPSPEAAALVALLAIAIGWGLRMATRMTGEARSNTWLDAIAVPVLFLLFATLSLSIPWERYAMVASYAWLLHGIVPRYRRAVAMALDRFSALPWGYLVGGAGILIALGAPFAPELGLNLESTRVAMLVTGFALLSLATYPRRPLPGLVALPACVAIGIFLFVYTERGGEYRPGPAASAGETLLAADRGDVVDWATFPANGDSILRQMERDHPAAFARLTPVIRSASCEDGRECAAHPIDSALREELGLLLAVTSNRNLADWNRLEMRVRERQYRSGNLLCGSSYLVVQSGDAVEDRRDYAALVLRIVAAGPRPLAERRDIALPDRAVVERGLAQARAAVAGIKAGPMPPAPRQRCIDQLVRVRMLSGLPDAVIARIARGGYDLEPRSAR